jgi:hypothetical protein
MVESKKVNLCGNVIKTYMRVQTVCCETKVKKISALYEN